MRYRHGPGREPLQTPRRRRRQSKSHKVHEENQQEYYGLSAGIPARNTTSCVRKHKNKSTCQSSTKKEITTKNDLFITDVLISTCTMLFSGMGVMVLRLQRTCSRQYGTYLSNRMVRLARSDWACLVSIQLATYLRKHEKKKSKHGC